MIEKLLTAVGLKRSINNPAVPLTSNRVLEYMGIDKHRTTVNASTALTISPVWQAVTMLSGDCAKLPLEVFERKPEMGDRARAVDKSHPAYWPCARAATGSMTAFRFWRRFYTHALIWNRAYFLIDKSDPARFKFLHLLPDRTFFSAAPEHRTATSPDGMYISEIDGELVPFASSEVFSIEGMAVDNSDECSLVKKARQSWAISLATQEMKSKFFESGGQAGGFLEIPAHFTEQAAENLELGFRQRQDKGVDVAFQTVILRDGAKWHQTTVNPDQFQMSATTADNVRDVARWFNIAPSKLGVQDSHSYGSKAEDNRAYHDASLSHWLTAVQTEAWLKLLTAEQQETDSHTFDHNVRALFAADPKTQAEVATIEHSMGALSADEYRAATNRNPLPGNAGKIITVPMNMHLITPDGTELNVYSPDEVDEVDEVDDTAPAVSEAVEAARQIMLADTDRATKAMLVAVKREATRKKPDRFVTWYENKRQELIDKHQATRQASQHVFAALSGLDVDELAEVRNEQTAGLIRQIDQAAGLPGEQIQSAITAICNKVTE